LRQAVGDLAAFTLGLRLACPGGAPLRLRLAFREDAEQGRPAGRIDFGVVAGPAGPLGIALSAPASRRAARRTARSPRRPVDPGHLRAELRGRLLTLRGPRFDPLVAPAAGSPLRLPGDRPALAGRLSAPGRRAGRLALVRRETIPGTGILLAPVVVSRPFRLRVGRPLPGLASRLARALRLVHLCWPEGHDDILRRTRMVVPVREPGTVSWSLAARPGISFINVFGKTLLDLADDLLHETAHHRLHDREEIEDLLVPGPQTAEVQAFRSPWRRAQRPLRGILHATFTFLFRAEFLARVLAMADRQPPLIRPFLGRRGRAWVRREFQRERRMLGASLRDLDRAARAGLLTVEGRRLARDLRAWHRRLSASGGLLRGGAAGRPQDR
jgi:HEXXH motif-containing protein